MSDDLSYVHPVNSGAIGNPFDTFYCHFFGLCCVPAVPTVFAMPASDDIKLTVDDLFGRYDPAVAA